MTTWAGANTMDRKNQQKCMYSSLRMMMMWKGGRNRTTPFVLHVFSVMQLCYLCKSKSDFSVGTVEQNVLMIARKKQNHIFWAVLGFTGVLKHK